jgi:hypothetical protein
MCNKTSSQTYQFWGKRGRRKQRPLPGGVAIAQAGRCKAGRWGHEGGTWRPLPGRQALHATPKAVRFGGCSPSSMGEARRGAHRRRHRVTPTPCAQQPAMFHRLASGWPLDSVLTGKEKRCLTRGRSSDKTTGTSAAQKKSFRAHYAAVVTKDGCCFAPGLGRWLRLGLGRGSGTWKCLGTAWTSILSRVKYNLPFKTCGHCLTTPHSSLVGPIGRPIGGSW